MEQRHRHHRALAAAALAALLGAAACGDPATASGADRRPLDVPAQGQARTPTRSPAESPAGTATPGAVQQPGKALPAPDEPIPKDAAGLAAALERTTTALDAAIDAWPKTGRPPRDVELLALHEQRVYRYAARHPKLASRAFARLPAALAAEAKDNTAAIRELLSLARPIKPSAVFKVRDPRPAAELLGYFKKAERRFGVEWEVLASVMFAETKFGRVRSDSHAGAQGPMQFMPATWKAYGMGGDIQDPRDAVMAAANYLRASGAPRDYQRALHAYNPSRAYVDAILAHARQIKRDPRNYYAYYNWQVYVITTAGERRLTGP
ncbi:transglycosylase SLT domain-containing protein [Nonomuraea phyllanthi]|uniref:lytic transglycosylase domain-containing protein n=1 Tax=Nonomuraea phyllanthi TaxID=2219224 RepID=UPI001293F23A|nr:lytic transglycosylase domain-containing protein [Nonomuraea phyllanthi]QFY10697.1 transglycosylase SLT domain-containing protein [Nonomuraea phyllanthi]